MLGLAGNAIAAVAVVCLFLGRRSAPRAQVPEFTLLLHFEEHFTLCFEEHFTLGVQTVFSSNLRCADVLNKLS